MTKLTGQKMFISMVLISHKYASKWRPVLAGTRLVLGASGIHTVRIDRVYRNIDQIWHDLA